MCVPPALSRLYPNLICELNLFIRVMPLVGGLRFWLCRAHFNRYNAEHGESSGALNCYLSHYFPSNDFRSAASSLCLWSDILGNP